MSECNCGWGGVHDPDNARCESNRMTDLQLPDDVTLDKLLAAYGLDQDDEWMADFRAELLTLLAEGAKQQREIDARIAERMTPWWSNLGGEAQTEAGAVEVAAAIRNQEGQ